MQVYLLYLHFLLSIGTVYLVQVDNDWTIQMEVLP